MQAALRARSAKFASLFSLEKVYAKNPRIKRTKVVGTLGPSSSKDTVQKELIENGLNVFRLNFSHGDHASQGATLDGVRKVAKGVRPYGMPVFMDLKGPSVRSGFMEGGNPVNLVAGQKLTVTTDYNVKGNQNLISCSYAKLPSSVKKGDYIFVGDGNMTLQVTRASPEEKLVETIVLNNYKMGERKNMNLPGNRVDLPTLTEKDIKDLKEFSIPKEIDAVSISFCRTAEDVNQTRSLLGARAKQTKIIAKIENHEGLNNLDEILKVVDVIMIARGDLGMEIPPEKVPIAQKWIIEKCREYRKPVITATQMLESMIKNSRATRAEISDVFNSILEGTDCVMLSGECANGDFPVQAVATQRNIAIEAESCIKYQKRFHKLIQAKNEVEGLIYGGVELSLQVDADLIVVISANEKDAHLVSALRPKAIIMAPFHCDFALRFFELFSGLYGVKAEASVDAKTKTHESVEFAKKLGLVEKGKQPKVVVINCNEMKVNLVQ